MQSHSQIVPRPLGRKRHVGARVQVRQRIRLTRRRTGYGVQSNSNHFRNHQCSAGAGVGTALRRHSAKSHGADPVTAGAASAAAVLRPFEAARQRRYRIRPIARHAAVCRLPFPGNGAFCRGAHTHGRAGSAGRPERCHPPDLPPHPFGHFHPAGGARCRFNLFARRHEQGDDGHDDPWSRCSPLPLSSAPCTPARSGWMPF